MRAYAGGPAPAVSHRAPTRGAIDLAEKRADAIL